MNQSAARAAAKYPKQEEPPPGRRPKALVVATGLMAAVFLLCVAVQYNDPDPIWWMAIYGLAAAACILYLARRLPPALSAGIGIVALIWAARLAPAVIGQVSPSEIFASIEMKSAAVEVAREMGGLLIVACWMAVLTAARRK